MYQLGQVQFTCRVDPYQEDATSVSISEDTSVDDPTEKNLDIRAGLTLQINKVSFSVCFSYIGGFVLFPKNKRTN